MPLADPVLLRMYAETGTNEAFAELVRRNVGLVYSAALRRLGGDAHRAADATQVVFTALARDANRLHRRSCLAPWLYATTRNVAVGMIRAERRRLAREQSAMHDLDSTDAPPDWERLRPILDEAMDRLSERDREAILLRYFSAQPFREIGAVLRVSEDAARMRVDRALERLRGILARRGVRSTGAALGLVLTQQAVGATPAALAHMTATAAVACAQGTPVASPFVLMITTHKALGAVCVAALICCGTAWDASQEARAAEAQRDAERERLRQELSQVVAAQSQLARVELDLETLQAKAATTAVDTPPDSGTHAGARGSTGSGRAAPSLASVDPEVAAHRAHERNKAEMAYTAQWRALYARGLPLLDRLGLAPAQRAAFEALGEFRYTAEDFADFGEEGRTVEYFNERTDRQWNDKVRAVLGDDTFTYFDRLMKADTAVQSIADYVSRLEIPLDRTQTVALFEALSSTQARGADGEIDWGYMEPRARSILTPAQHAAWIRQRDLVQFQRELTEAYTRGGR